MQLTFDSHGAVKLIADLQSMGKQTQFATMRAMNAAVARARTAAQEGMHHAFDRPTPWVIGGIRYTKARKERMVATLDFDFWGNKQGVTVSQILWAEVHGGPRALKRHEIALQRIGVLPNGMFIVPGQAAQLDRYGNMSPGQINQILSWFAAFGEQGYRANMTDAGRAKKAKGTKRRRGIEYFALQKQNGRMPAGIYKRIHFGFGGAVQPVMIFVRQPQYSQRFDFYGIANRVAGEEFNRAFPEMLNEAMRTAR
jgi:hypothetical protein